VAVGLLVDADLSLDISSAITLSFVLIHEELMPTFEPIMSPQNNLERARPIIDFMQVCVVHFFALMLPVMHKTAGYGLSMMDLLLA
jgi:hypothetical protein